MSQAKDGKPIVVGQVVKFEMRKNAAYQTFHVDGAWGGITAAKLIHMSVFAEYPMVPLQVGYKVASAGSLEPQAVIPATDIVATRELAMGLMMTKDVANSIIAWLQERIHDLEKYDADAMGGRGR